jgi:LytS/YehU family sensor histidine kinase
MPSFHFDLKSSIWQQSIGLVEFMIVFYVFYFVIHTLLRKTNLNWKNILLAVFIFTLLVIQRWVWGFLPVLNSKNLTFVERLSNSTIGESVFGIIITFLQGCMALILKTILLYFDEKKLRKELETTNLKNELNMLRSQVNPHFLFNTLNNIDALIYKDPKKASDLLIKLSDEMRYMLYDSNIEKIDIMSELMFLNNYISLQKIRINQKEPIILNIDLDNKKEKIPPMLFLPLVENAFKHGRFASNDDMIKLKLKLKDHHLDFSIANPYEPGNIIIDSQRGLGLGLVKRRFDLIFPHSNRFEIKKDEQIFSVEFSLDLNEA